jgi:hypothetical protein
MYLPNIDIPEKVYKIITFLKKFMLIMEVQEQVVSEIYCVPVLSVNIIRLFSTLTKLIMCLKYLYTT